MISWGYVPNMTVLGMIVSYRALPGLYDVCLCACCDIAHKMEWLYEDRSPSKVGEYIHT